jgi:hypothetical protein
VTVLVAALLAVATRPGDAGEDAPQAPIVFTQVPIAAGRPAPSTATALPAGSRIVSLDPAHPGREPIVLTTGFAAAGRPDVSFDGRRILFVGRRSPDDPIDVWEMSADGSDPRRIAASAGDCTAAIYLSRIYTIDAEQPVHQIAFCGSPGDGGGPALFTCRMDGSRIRRITFNPHGATDPFQLDAGRLLFASWRPVSPDQAAADLLTVHTDGADIFIFADPHGAPVIRGMPCQMTDGRVAFIESAPSGVDRGGALVAVSSTASLHSRQVIADDPEGLYRCPAPDQGDTLLVSYRRRDGGSYGIHRLDPSRGTRVALVHDSPDFHELDAALLRPRPQPKGRSSVVDERMRTGWLYGLDASLSDRPHRREGRAEALRIFAAVIESGSSRPLPAVGQTLLGTAQVEADGSFHVAVPARTPLRLQTLDENGQVLQAMTSWIWVMPREARGCIGCHEDRELSPPNRHALALRRPPQPIGLPGTAVYDKSGEDR